VVTHSQSFHDEQARGFEQTLAKARRQLSELTARLARGGGRKNAELVQAEIDKILRPQWLSRVISVTLSGTKPLRAAHHVADQASGQSRIGRRIVRQAGHLH
jgi:phosphoenolpyruvate-protein kinase (PTS system EI component)